MYLLRHRCEYTTGILERGCGREADKARGVAECLIRFRDPRSIRGVEALRNDSGVSVTSTKGKLKVLQSHYQCLGSCSVDDAFDDNWKQEVDSKVNECHRCSVEHDDPVLDGEIELPY